MTSGQELATFDMSMYTINNSGDRYMPSMMVKRQYNTTLKNRTKNKNKQISTNKNTKSNNKNSNNNNHKNRTDQTNKRQND